jgi:twitching motility protein PilT
VIFVGELRDPETVAVALHSAETSHLVLSTLRATNTTTAIERAHSIVRHRLMDVRVVISRSAAYAAGWATTTRARSAGRSPS